MVMDDTRPDDHRSRLDSHQEVPALWIGPFAMIVLNTVGTEPGPRGEMLMIVRGLIPAGYGLPSQEITMLLPQFQQREIPAQTVQMPEPPEIQIVDGRTYARMPIPAGL